MHRGLVIQVYVSGWGARAPQLEGTWNHPGVASYWLKVKALLLSILPDLLWLLFLTSLYRLLKMLRL